MIRRAFQVFFLCFSLILPLHAAHQLEMKDVKKWMDRLMDYHIEHKELKPLLVKRLVKLYVEQFDPDRSYLLKKEALPYILMSEERAKQVLQRLQKEDFSDFSALNALFAKAIKRARSIRCQIALELLDQSINVDESADISDYSLNKKDFYLRQALRVHQLYQLHQKRIPIVQDQQKKQMIALIEKRIQRAEDRYLIQNESLYALQILKAFAKSLDAHSTFFTEEEAFEMRMNLEKQFEGLGVILAETIHGVMIVDLIKGSPAEKCGKIQINDLIVGIDDKIVTEKSFEEVLDLLKARKDKEILLMLRRYSSSEGNLSKSWNVALHRQPISIEDERLQFSYEPYGDGIVGKIILSSFYENSEGITSERDMRHAIDQLREKGKLYGVILDLRENAGGFLSQAVKVASLFISNGVIVISKYSKGEMRILRNFDSHPYFQGPVVVLTSRLSASASEIVAQTLQDYGVAIIVGDETTFGKGSIQYQTVTNEEAEAFFKVTVGKYYTVSGKSTQIAGVKADIVVPTIYAPYHFGERFLEYPLPGDEISPLYADTLQDVDIRARQWFEKNYFPTIQKKVSFWHEQLPVLKENSHFRLEHDPTFSCFMKNLEDKSSIKEKNIGLEDLQFQEAVNILKDMILIDNQKKTSIDSQKDKH